MRGLLIAAAALAMAACSIDVDYSGTGFRCTDDPTCPPGSMCVDGFCRSGPGPGPGEDAGEETDAVANQMAAVSIAATEDDAEESLVDNTIALSSISLEMGVGDVEGNQIIGMRFVAIGIPAGSDVVAAAIQLSAGEIVTEPAELDVRAQADDDAPEFADVAANLSTRPTTLAKVTWQAPPWPTVGERGDDQRTPDLAALIEELIARPGWTAGNAIVIVVSGTGRRVADSFDSTGEPPALVIEFTAP